MSHSPETNSTKRVDEKRSRVVWPVEKIKKKGSKQNLGHMQATAHTNISYLSFYYKKNNDIAV